MDANNFIASCPNLDKAEFFRLAEEIELSSTADTAHEMGVRQVVRDLAYGDRAAVANAVDAILAMSVNNLQDFGAFGLLDLLFGRDNANTLYDAYRDGWQFETDAGALHPVDMAVEAVFSADPVV